MTIQKIKSGRVITVTADQYVGPVGTIFYNEDVGDLRLGDGHTAGGVPLLVAGVSTATSSFANNLSIVANIAARDAIAPATGDHSQLVYVVDAGGGGSATYLYNTATSAWVNISAASSSLSSPGLNVVGSVSPSSNTSSTTSTNITALIFDPAAGFSVTNLGNGQALVGAATVVYAERVDFNTDLMVYRGQAVPGSITSSPVWRIQQIIVDPVVDDKVSIKWANGESTFSNIWDDHISILYQ